VIEERVFFLAVVPRAGRKEHLESEFPGTIFELLDLRGRERAGLAAVLVLEDLEVAEGSGIYRHNRVSARQMMRVLEAFEPNYVLLRQQGRDFYKTGTLHGINTRAGYVASQNGGRYRYVVMVNTPGKSIRPIMRQLIKILD
jgi:D-alanyl-D-alanine carboxypeptidase/D-alanyl-D-alanine-endopeptidase (penicillin-binding protein 4)